MILAHKNIRRSGIGMHTCSLKGMEESSSIFFQIKGFYNLYSDLHPEIFRLSYAKHQSKH